VADSSWPGPNHNARAVNDIEYERLLHPITQDGFLGVPTDPPPVYADATGLQVKIRAERVAVIRGHAWYSGTTEFTKPITANTSGQTRTDLAVLRLSRSSFDVTVEVLAGTPGASAPTPTQDSPPNGVWELPLAEVTVPTAATTVTADAVKNRTWYLSDPTYLCDTEASRPPHRYGRQIKQLDTNTDYLSTGTTWQVLREDTGWVDAPPATGYTTGVAVRRKNGLVTMQVAVQRTGAAVADTVDSPIATIPAGHRPDRDIVGVINCTRPDSISWMSISPTGVLLFRANYSTGIDSAGYLFTTATWPT
jgi:hypothetical protein